jgi:hypothetical protein
MGANRAVLRVHKEKIGEAEIPQGFNWFQNHAGHEQDAAREAG